MQNILDTGSGASIPVLIYHSIGPHERIDVRLFEAHLRALARSGLPSLRAADLDDAEKGFLVTFDDGFADIWTHALPLLEKYRIHAVVFALPSFMDEGPVRPRGEWTFAGAGTDALREASRTGAPHAGFLRWSEAAALEASGWVEIHSHSLAHRAGWSRERIRGFHLGHSHWALEQITGGDVRLGIPLYSRRSALAARLYHDDPGLRDALAAWLESRGGQGYVAERGEKAVQAELHREAQTYREAHPSGGRFESEEERRARVTEDLGRARALLEERLGGRRDELCLPWGHHSRTTLECARAVGVRRVYTTAVGPNPAGRIGFLVNRFGPMRSNGPLWLRSRLWVYRSVRRAALYAKLRK